MSIFKGLKTKSEKERQKKEAQKALGAVRKLSSNIASSAKKTADKAGVNRTGGSVGKSNRKTDEPTSVAKKYKENVGKAIQSGVQNKVKSTSGRLKNAREKQEFQQDKAQLHTRKTKETLKNLAERTKSKKSGFSFQDGDTVKKYGISDAIDTLRTNRAAEFARSNRPDSHDVFHSTKDSYGTPTYVKAESETHNWGNGFDVGADKMMLSDASYQKVQKLKQQWQEANARGDTKAAEDAHRAAESIRAAYGYSGGMNGGAYNEVAAVESSEAVARREQKNATDIRNAQKKMDALRQSGVGEDSPEFKIAQDQYNAARDAYISNAGEDAEYWANLILNGVDGQRLPQVDRNDDLNAQLRKELSSEEKQYSMLINGGRTAEEQAELDRLNAQRDDLWRLDAAQKDASVLSLEQAAADYVRENGRGSFDDHMGLDSESDMVNGVPSSTGYMQPVQAGGYVGDQAEALSKYMTQEEKDTYNYIRRTQGADAASLYLADTEERRNQRWGAEIAQDQKSAFDKIMYGFASGLDRSVAGAAQLFSEKAIPTSKTQFAGEQVRSDLQEKGGFYSALYDLANTTGNQIPQMAIAALTGGLGAPAWVSSAVSSGLTAATVGGSTYTETIKEGYTPEQARAYAAVSGALEGGLQYVLNGVAAVGGGAIPGAVRNRVSGIENGIVRFAMNYGSEFVSEGLEEGLQDVLDPMVRTLVLDEEYEPADLSDVLYSFLLGAVSAGVLNVAPEISKYTGGKAVLSMRESALDRIVADGMQQARGSTARELAQRILQKRQAGETVSPYSVGELWAETRTKLSGEDALPATQGQAQEVDPDWAESASEVPDNVSDTFNTAEEAGAAAEAITEQTVEEALLNAAYEAENKTADTDFAPADFFAPAEETSAAPITAQMAAPLTAQTAAREQVRSDMEQTNPTRTPSAAPLTAQTAAMNRARNSASGRSVTEAREDMIRANRMAATLGVSGSRMFHETYSQDAARSLDADTAFDGYSALYYRALTGQEIPNASRAAVNALPQEMAFAAVSAGETDLRRAQQARYFGKDSGLLKDSEYRAARIPSKTARQLDALAKTAGIQIRFAGQVNGGEANASYQNGVLTIARDTEDPLYTAVTHEVVHRIREAAPEVYGSLVQFLTENMSGETFGRLLSDYKAAYGMTGSGDVAEEVVAQAFGKVVGTQEFWDAFCRDNRTAGQKILDTLRDIINAIKNALSKTKGVRMTREETVAFRELLGKYEEMASALEKALDRVSERAAEAGRNTVENKSETQYNEESEGKKYSRKGTELNERTKGTEVSDRRRNENHVSSLEHNDAGRSHERRGVGRGNPGDNANHAGSGTAILAETGSLSDYARRRVTEIIALSLDEGEAGRNLLKMLGTDAAVNRVYQAMTEDTQLFERHCEVFPELRSSVIKIQNLLAGESREQAEIAWLQNNHKDESPYSGKRNSEGDRTTEAQEKYFVATVVRDVNGFLLVVYHGTQEDFESFKIGDIGYHVGTKTQAEYRIKGEDGAKLIPLYANITNPLHMPMDIGEWYGTYMAGMLIELEVFEDAENRSEIEDRLSEIASMSDEDAATDQLKNYLMELGYDGIVYENRFETENAYSGEYDYSYIAFSSNQLKYVSNKNPTDSPYQRFSLKSASRFDREAAALQRENERLKERVNYWKNQLKRSNPGAVNPVSVKRTAEELSLEFSSKVDRKELAGNLQLIYDEMGKAKAGGKTDLYESVRAQADDLAAWIVDDAVEKGDLYTEYEALRDYVKNNALFVPASVRADIPDFNEWKKGKGIRISSDGIPIDTAYTELSQRWPEWFDEQEESTPSDQLLQLADVMSAIYGNERVNPFAGYYEQAVSDVSNEILNRFFELPENRTFADRMDRKLQKEKQKRKDTVSALREESRRKRKEERERIISGYQEKLRKVREDRERKLSALREKQRAKDKAGRERQNRRELRAKIERSAARLSQWIRKPTDKQHIPQEFRGSVAAVLHAINLESNTLRKGKPTAKTEAFRALQEQYQDIMRQETSGFLVYNADLFETGGILDGVIRNGDKPILDMNAAELENVHKVLLAFEHMIQTAGKNLTKSKYATTEAWANTLRDYSKTRKHKTTRVAVDLLNPITFFSTYGEAGDAMYRSLRDGQDKQTMIIREAAEYLENALPKEFDIQKERKNILDFSLENGGSVSISKTQLMDLWLSYQQKEGKKHLLGGGIFQPQISRKKIAAGSETLSLTEGDLETMFEALTETDRETARVLQHATTLLAKHGNEASMQAYGYEKFTNETYWMLHVGRDSLKTDVEKTFNRKNIANIGIAKNRVEGAAQPLMVTDAFDSLARHVGDMSLYSAYLCPVEDIVRLYNFNYARQDSVTGIWERTGESVRSVMDSIYGDRVKKGDRETNGETRPRKYLMTLLSNIQNEYRSGTESELMGAVEGLVSAAKGAAVGLNMRVVIQQPTAWARALEVLSPAHMTRGLSGGATKGNGWAKAKKYAPIAQMKDWGSFDISRGPQLQSLLYGVKTAKDRVNDFTGAMAGFADAVTWGKLWNACEWQTKARNSDLRVGSEAFYRATARLFSDVVNRTQVVDGVLQRAQIMRDRDALARQATAFRGEPLMTYNMIARAWDKVRYSTDKAARARAKKHLARACTAFLLNAVLNAFAQSVMDGVRDDDKDKNYIQRVMAAALGINGDEETTLERLKGFWHSGNLGDNLNMINNIPFMDEVQSMLSGYKVERMDTATINKIIQNGKLFIEAVGGDNKKTLIDTVWGLASSIGDLFGLPASTVKRDSIGFLRTFGGDGNLAWQYALDRFQYSLKNKSNLDLFVGDMLRAADKGDEKLEAKIYRDLMDAGIMPEDIEKKKNSLLKDKLGKEHLTTLTNYGELAAGFQVAKNSVDDESWLDNATASQQKKYYEARERILEDVTGSFSEEFLDKVKETGVEQKSANALTKLASEMAKMEADDDYVTETKWIQDAVYGKEYDVDPSEIYLYHVAYEFIATGQDENGDGEADDGTKASEALDLYKRFSPDASGTAIGYVKSSTASVPKELKELSKDEIVAYNREVDRKYTEIDGLLDANERSSVSQSALSEFDSVAMEYAREYAVRQVAPKDKADEKYTKQKNGVIKADSNLYLYVDEGVKRGIDAADLLLFESIVSTSKGVDADNDGQTDSYSKKREVFKRAKAEMPWLSQSDLTYMVYGHWANMKLG